MTNGWQQYASRAFCQHWYALSVPFKQRELAMTAATRTAENSRIKCTVTVVEEIGDCVTASQANGVIRDLARALARMAAREDDAKENGV
jgi:uncharacterized protein GlcG (DUF336 family)